jgi:uracil-DNA glycosylase family 4
MSLEALSSRVIACRKCPRLVTYRKGLKRQDPSHECRPVPGFGDTEARILIVGLAPGRLGANRTGRMFTGDASGRFLYKALYECGLSNRPDAVARDDGLVLRGVYITAALRCVPPGNKPEPRELENCGPYLEEEIRLLRGVRVVVALGAVAHRAYFRAAQAAAGQPAAHSQKWKITDYPFAHGALSKFGSTLPPLLSSYHPSPQNTNTGKLTPTMFRAVFRKARRLAGWD